MCIYMRGTERRYGGAVRNCREGHARGGPLALRHYSRLGAQVRNSRFLLFSIHHSSIVFSTLFT